MGGQGPVDHLRHPHQLPRRRRHRRATEGVQAADQAEPARELSHQSVFRSDEIISRVIARESGRSSNPWRCCGVLDCRFRGNDTAEFGERSPESGEEGPHALLASPALSAMQNAAKWSRLLRVQLPEICGQSPCDQNAGPPNNGRGDEPISALRKHALGFPVRALPLHRVEIEPSHHKAGTNEGELYQERSVGDIFRRLGHPQGESAEELENHRNPKMKTKPMTIAVPNACTVSANGHPHNDSPLAHSENAEFSRYSSTV